jgi:hypothetical protein
VDVNERVKVMQKTIHVPSGIAVAAMIASVMSVATNEIVLVTGAPKGGKVVLIQDAPA